MKNKSEIPNSVYEEALLIRRVEDTFLDLFSEGKLNGTVHTCSGQEFSALSISSNMNKDDYIFSSHRCHGHYIAHTGDVKGLIAELMGKRSGACGGIGSSQHLFNDNFYSNGIQGGIVPVAAGVALAEKQKDSGRVVVVFIGDGTLGEGVVYETMNMASLLGLPLHIVCENNMYSQSTSIKNSLAGNILDRPKAFGIKTFHSNTWDLEELFVNAKQSIAHARTNQPVFHLIDTYRLNHHSKSDDKRDEKEVERYAKKDTLNIYLKNNPKLHKSMLNKIDSVITNYIDELDSHKELSVESYIDQNCNEEKYSYIDIEDTNERVVTRINSFFHENMEKNKDLYFIGEDILSPYGGAFKVAENLSEKYPNNVISTPISEGAISGIVNGMALAGLKPYMEIMFGDFITLAMDQIINHASKFHHMYNKQISCPVVIRTPMGGGRGYGPTHSQTMDKFLVGIDNVTIIALNSVIDPKKIYQNIYENERHPVIVIENKLDYGRFCGAQKLDDFIIEQSTHLYPVVKCSPKMDMPELTMVTYGGISQDVVNSVYDIFMEVDLVPEIIILSKISPLDINPVLDSLNITKRLIVIEEGGKEFGIGAEIVAQVVDNMGSEIIFAKRVGALPVPIPSSESLEKYVLPNTTLAKDIFREVR